MPERGVPRECASGSWRRYTPSSGRVVRLEPIPRQCSNPVHAGARASDEPYRAARAEGTIRGGRAFGGRGFVLRHAKGSRSSCLRRSALRHALSIVSSPISVLSSRTRSSGSLAGLSSRSDHPPRKYRRATPRAWLQSRRGHETVSRDPRFAGPATRIPLSDSTSTVPARPTDRLRLASGLPAEIRSRVASSSLASRTLLRP